MMPKSTREAVNTPMRKHERARPLDDRYPCRTRFIEVATWTPSATTFSTARNRQRVLPDGEYAHSVIDLVARGPREHDFPLWRIKCRVQFHIFSSNSNYRHTNLLQFGIEEDAVCFLVRAALDNEENPSPKDLRLRSAFTRGSNRGQIYVEAQMTVDLERLLAEAPGLVKGLYGIHKERIDIKDWTALLTWNDAPEAPKIGEWVSVRRGTYKGDVGLVCGKPNWGGVTLLLIPRMPFPFQSKQKCKHGASSTPALFDPHIVQQRYNPDNDPDLAPIQISATTYKFNRVLYEYGLVRQNYNNHSISGSLSSAPGNTLFTIMSSQHPFLSNHHIICPSEWHFFDGEKVCIIESGVQGAVTGVFPTYIMVQDSIGNLLKAYWLGVCKIIKPGDYVEVLGGSFVGKKGSVSAVKDTIAEICGIPTGNAGPEVPHNLEVSFIL